MKLGKFELDEIYCGDCKDLIKDLPNNSIDMVITSPPYWGLRDYGIGEDQLGLEPDFNLYIKHLCDIFDEVKRVLKDEGTCWVNMGDTYGGTGAGQEKSPNSKGKFTDGQYFEQAKARELKARTTKHLSKSLCLIPFRFAIEMVNRGWILRNTIIWHKPNCMPSSAKDRFTVDFEYLFFFVNSSISLYWINSKTYQRVDKQPKGTQGIEGIDWEWKEHLTCKGKGCDNKRCINGKIKNSFWEGKDYYFEQQFESLDIKEMEYRHKLRKNKNYDLKYTDKSQQWADRGGFLNYQGRNKRAVWSITTKGFKEAHFAVFPPKLIETPIRAGCPEFVCKKCGKPRKKIYKSTTSFHSGSGKSGNIPKGKWEGKEQQISGDYDIRMGPRVEHDFLSYSDCKCNTGFRSGIVLDPFIGSGTTGKIAIKLNRHFLGFDIKSEYVEMANRRLESVQVSLL